MLGWTDFGRKPAKGIDDMPALSPTTCAAAGVLRIKEKVFQLAGSADKRSTQQAFINAAPFHPFCSQQGHCGRDTPLIYGTSTMKFVKSPGAAKQVFCNFCKAPAFIFFYQEGLIPCSCRGRRSV